MLNQQSYVSCNERFIIQIQWFIYHISKFNLMTVYLGSY